MESLINRSSVMGELGDWLDLPSSLRCRWAPLGPRIRPGWKHPVFRIRLVWESGKNVYDKYFLCPKNIALCTKIFFKTMYK